MLTNADCTLYLWGENGYTRHEIHGVYWNENRTANIQKFGVWDTKTVTLYIFDNNIIPKTLQKDLIVKGICDFEIDNNNITKSREEFLKKYKVFAVQAIDDKYFGGLPHYEILLK